MYYCIAAAKCLAGNTVLLVMNHALISVFIPSVLKSVVSLVPLAK